MIFSVPPASCRYCKLVVYLDTLLNNNNKKKTERSI